MNRLEGYFKWFPAVYYFATCGGKKPIPIPSSALHTHTGISRLDLWFTISREKIDLHEDFLYLYAYFSLSHYILFNKVFYQQFMFLQQYV